MTTVYAPALPLDLAALIDVAPDFCTRYAMHGAAVEVRTNHAGLIDFCDEYFSGYTSAACPPGAQLSVCVLIDPDRAEELRQAYPSQRLAESWQVSETMDIVYQCEDGNGGASFVYAVIDHQAARVCVLPAEYAVYGKHQVVRAIRTCIQLLLLERSTLLMHAGCVVKGGYGLAFTGNKCAGKTTTLINTLLRGPAAFMANDKVFIDIQPTGARVLGLPVSAGVRIGTFQQFPPLLPSLAERAGLHADNLAVQPDHLGDPRTRIYLTPQQLTALLNCAIEPAATLRCFVIPEYAPGVERAELSRLPADRAAGYLADQYLPAAFPQQPYWDGVLARRHPTTPEWVADRIRRLSQSVPVYRLTQNERTHAESARLLYALLDGDPVIAPQRRERR